MSKLNPKDVPSSVFEQACPILNDCIRRMLADPVKKAEYEAWKLEQRKKEML